MKITLFVSFVSFIILSAGCVSGGTGRSAFPGQKQKTQKAFERDFGKKMKQANE